MSPVDWHPLVDLPRLAAWMDSEGLTGGPIEAPMLLTGGTQNILLRFARGGREFVLRRPPAHTIANGSETMRREARVLGALADTAVPHPRLIASCPHEDVLGAAFYLMEPVDGFNATEGLPQRHAANPDIRRQMGLAMVDAIAALGRLDPFVLGLGDFGKLENFLQRQPARWRSQLDGYARNPGWPGPGAIPGVPEVGNWLEVHCPADFTPGIMHGDYHLFNVMFCNDGPEVAAIVDWELATLGDPLIDLGWMLATWPDSSDIAAQAPVVPWDGFPDAEALIERYRAASLRDLSAITWYEVLACYKLGILLEGTYARAAAGKADARTGDFLHRRTIQLFQRALRLIGRG